MLTFSAKRTRMSEFDCRSIVYWGSYRGNEFKVISVKQLKTSEDRGKADNEI